MEYTEFLSKLEPTLLGLDSTTALLDREAYWSPHKDARRLLSSRYAVTRVAKDYFDIRASFSLALQWSEGDGPVNYGLRIECVFTGHFHAASPVNSEHVQKFADSSAWLVFWPFFRQFVTDTTARMGIPPIVVPMAVGPGEISAREKPSKKALEDHKPTKGAKKRQRRRVGSRGKAR